MSQVTTCDHVINKPAGIIDEEKGLYRSQTAVTMSPELFEKVTQHHTHPTPKEAWKPILLPRSMSDSRNI